VVSRNHLGLDIGCIHRVFKRRFDCYYHFQCVHRPPECGLYPPNRETYANHP